MALESYRASDRPTLSRVLKWELDPLFCRENGVIAALPAAQQVLEIGTVLGRRRLGAPVAAPAGGGSNGANTGTGVLSLLARTALTVAGVYSLVCVAAAQGAGTFAVIAPDGTRLRDHTAGTAAYAGEQLRFKLTAGNTDWAVGDGFAVTVPEGDGKLVPLDLAAADGSQVAAAILAARVTVPAGQDAVTVVLARQALVAAGQLVWPEGATADQKAAALKQLASAGLLIRQGA